MNDSLPGDGWIKLAPGEWVAFHEDTPLSPTVEQLQHWMHKLRGSVLSQSFGIENELVLLSLASEFGTNDYSKTSQTYFEREQSWREEHNLARKIERIGPIIRQKGPREFADRLMGKLAEYRELRHLMAHYPGWIEPANDPDRRRTISLKLFIADRRHVWEIDEAQARAWDKVLAFVRTSVENVRREIIGAPLLADSAD